MSIWLSTALAAAAATAPAPTQVETLEYTIRKGDSCAKIAKERYGDRKHYEVIHQYNRWLGPTLPHRLQEGQVLVLPKELPPELPDAEVTAARRTVEARSPRAPQWSNARPGLDLYRGWRVNTQERASAEITFRDYSRISMRENTVVIIYGGSRSRARRETTEATLDRGALRARLGAYTGKSYESAVDVTTPSAVAELDGGNSLITVDPEGTSRVANHGKGKAQVRSSSKGGKVKVGPRMGSKVVKDARPGKPRPLPPTPRWSGKAITTFVAVGGRGTIHGTWTPVEKAEQYRIEIAEQPDGRELVTSQTVPASASRFEARGLPPGDYYVSIASIDDDVFESPPSDYRKLSVISVPLLTPGGAPLPELGDDAEEQPDRVLRGTRLDVPPGLRCAVDGGEPTRAPVFDASGPHSVDCVTDDDVPVPGFSISVVDVQIAATEVDAAARGETTTARFTLSAEVPLPRRVWVAAPEGVLVDSTRPGEADGEWTVTALIDDDAPAETSLRVMAEAGGTEVELGQIPLRISEEPTTTTGPTTATTTPPPGPPSRPERHILELGLAGGVMFPSADHDLVQPTFYGAPGGPDSAEHQPLRRVAPSIGIRIGYYPIRWVGAEIEHMLVPTRTRQTDDRATVLGIRAQLVAQLPWRITPTVHVGGGALGISSGQALGRDLDEALHFGAGAKFYVTRWAMIRLDVRDVVSPGLESRAAHSPEILLGLSGVIGRRSAASPTGRRLRVRRSASTESEVSSSP